MLLLLLLVVLLLKSVEFDDDVTLLISVAGLDVGPHLTPESEIGGTDSAAPRKDIVDLSLALWKLCDGRIVDTLSADSPSSLAYRPTPRRFFPRQLLLNVKMFYV